MNWCSVMRNGAKYVAAAGVMAALFVLTEQDKVTGLQFLGVSTAVLAALGVHVAYSGKGTGNT